MVVAGVMSGSSLDGLDIAVVEFGDSGEWQILWTTERSYSSWWVERLKEYRTLTAQEYIVLKADYGKYIGNMLVDVFKEYGRAIDYVSFHGHTLMHLPSQGITEQIGNGGIIAAITGVPTITDFRIQDVTKGGVGTPLAPIVELNMFEGYDYYLNLGGIANLSKVYENRDVIAYDVCPCNQVLNHYSNLLGKEYDKGGEIARTGKYNSDLETYLNSIDYFRFSAPKSIDNNWIIHNVIPGFPEADPKDILHSYCHWMAQCIGNEIEGGKDTQLMVSGGGAHNTFFMECLREALSDKNCTLTIPSDQIINYKEAILMSLLAWKYMRHEVNVLAQVTGATSDSIGGALYKVKRI